MNKIRTKTDLLSKRLLILVVMILFSVILYIPLAAQVAVISGGAGAPAGTGVNGNNNAGGDATGLGCGGGGGSWWGGTGGAGMYGGGGGGGGGYFSSGAINWAGGDGGQGVVVIAYYNGATFLNSVVLISGNSVTVGAGVTSAKVWAIGGGGGGGGATESDPTAGGAGGAGGTAYITKNISQGDVINYTIGSSGKGGHGATILATSGGNTSVTIAGTTINGNGGGPGIYQNTSIASGGTYSGGDGGSNGGTGAGSSGDDGGGGGGAIGAANGTQNGNDGGTGANSIDISGLFAVCSVASIQNAPSLSSFTPTSGLVGTTVTVTGTGFTGATAVSFGGINASSFTVNSATEIVATVAGTSKTGSVSVTLPFLTVSKPIYFFTAPSLPSISSFTPTTATTGATVTINGSNFLGVTSVSFGGTPALSFTVISNFKIEASVASGTSGSVSVTSSAGTSSLAGFTYTAPPAPSISSFTPTSASTGQTVNITGSNFSGATAVSFGGTASSSFTVNSATSISAIVGAGTTGSASVTTSAGTASLAGFTFINPIQASDISFSSIQETQMTIGWTNGNGTKRAVFVKAGTGTAAPVNNTTYAVSPAFGSGAQIGSTGWYCVYNNTGNSLTLIGLVSGTQYTVQVFEYNGNASNEKYNITTSTNNPKSQTTSSNKPTVTTQAVSNVTSTTATGNGNVSAIGSANVTERGIYYSTSDGFADGAGTKVSTTGNWSATGSFTQAVTGLTANTLYYVKAFATNSAGSSYGSQVSFSSVTWEGSSSTDWDTGANWSDGSVPITSTHAIIPSGKTIIISPTTTASCASLSNSGTLTIQSTATNSGSLIVEGSFTGTLTYERYVTGSKWHLVGTPVTGQAISSLLTNASNDIVVSGSDYSMKDHTESSNNWSALYTSATAGNFALGQGYAAKRNSDGVISFTGTVNTSSVTIPLSRGSYGWTLVANPYTSAIGVTVLATSTGECLTDNTSVMDANFSALYLWDEQAGYSSGRNDYKTISNAGGGTLQHYVNVGQGFFIRSKSGGGNFVFTTSMQIHQNAASFKSTEEVWPTIRLNVQSDDLSSYTQIFYHEDMTRGLDVSYDAGMLKANPNFALYSRLVEDNGIDFAIQCLPKDYDNLIIPIGLDAQNGSVITFTAETLDLPEGYRLVIEDRKMDIFTTLESSEDSYSTTISAMDNFPRFYVHTKSALLAIDDLEQNDGLQIIPQPQNNLIQVIGDLGDNAQLLLYDMTGRNLLNTTLEQTNVNNVAVGLLKSGNYVVVIRSATQNSTKKISWIK